MSLAALATEQHRSALLDLDLKSTSDQVELMLRDQMEAVAAVGNCSAAIVRAVDAIVAHLRSGPGRVIYVGAGTPGRIGSIDAAECMPTFGSDRFIALVAGGLDSMHTAQESVEDDVEAGRQDVADLEVNRSDVVVGIAASGRTPYTLSAVQTANDLGALTIGVSSNPESELSRTADYSIEALTGAELIAGSTRLKAGTAQKVVLNTLSTLVMVQLGHTFGNLMVDMATLNHKLASRRQRMIVQATGASQDRADAALVEADGDHKVAITGLLLGVDAETARRRLAASDGVIRAALGG